MERDAWTDAPDGGKRMKSIHAITRAYDRYGLVLTADDLNTITQLIQSNHGELEWMNADQSMVWWITYKNTRLRLILTADFYTVITFLPPFMKKKRPKKKPRQIRRSIYSRGQKRYVIAYRGAGAGGAS